CAVAARRHECLLSFASPPIDTADAIAACHRCLSATRTPLSLEDAALEIVAFNDPVEDAALQIASFGGAVLDGAALEDAAFEDASSDIVEESGILTDPDAVARLVALIPEGQRTEEDLRDNLCSPQVVQCLRHLTAALTDDAGSFNSTIADFQLNPGDGAVAMARGDPVVAFLECLLWDVERRGEVKEEMKGEEGRGGGRWRREGDEEGQWRRRRKGERG
ncbi:hypothetical protein ACHAWF_001887, partial [Thalassiosira exigua]